MRAMWKGAISFGLVSIGVQAYSAVEDKDLHFHQVHREDGGRVRYQKTCEVCGNEVFTEDLVRGFDVGGGQLVLLDDPDFEHLPLSTSKVADVIEFVPAEQVDPILFAQSYYLEPQPIAVKPYALLRDALRDSAKVGIVKVALRQKERLATLRVHDEVLVLETMLWPDEIREPDFAFLLRDDVTPRPQELAMAASLMQSMAHDFHPEAYTDRRREALEKIVEAKITGREIVAPPAAAPTEGTGVIDLMEALKASVAKARNAQPPAAEKQATNKRPSKAKTSTAKTRRSA